jgi:hypothetical protein
MWLHNHLISERIASPGDNILSRLQKHSTLAKPVTEKLSYGEIS